MSLSVSRFTLGFAALAFLVGTVRADEGMWLYTNPPREYLKKKYDFPTDEKWLDHVRMSSVRFPSGSGSFVSPDGLVMTNHHVGLEVLQQISTKEKDFVKEGFLARTRDQEVKAKQSELNVLMSIEDVTRRVQDAVKPGMTPDKAAAARRAAMSEIEKESKEKTKLESELVTLYHGAQYHLYRYKKYTDVRLVFAPEQQIAFYGGDPDNFEYPRYCLDVCFFRVYEDGKPAKIEHYLKWSKSGLKDGDLVFVSGHPGRTDRLNTLAELEYMRDRSIPFAMQYLYRLEVAYSVYSSRSAENARRAKEELFSIQNSRKAREGGLGGLLDPRTMARKQAEEQKLRDAVATSTDLADAAKSWERVAGAQQTIGKSALNYNLLEAGRGFNSQMFGLARTLVRAAEERPKPNRDRLREYSEAGLESLQERLTAEETIHKDFEIVKLADSLTFLAGQLGGNHPVVKKVLAGKSAQERAAEVVLGSKLDDPKVRKTLYDGGLAAIKASKDPMIALARSVDGDARAVRKIIEAQGEIKQQAHAQISRAKFAVSGGDTYPDATFTLRLAFGQVKGYQENGKPVPSQTSFAGLYERAAEHKNKEPFDLPPRWVERKDRLDLSVPFNFVATPDIIGGNSGSPVVNRNAEVVGLIFDGNIQSLVLDFIYSEEQARALSVSAQGIVEALRKIYEANDLANELTGGK